MISSELTIRRIDFCYRRVGMHVGE